MSANAENIQREKPSRHARRDDAGPVWRDPEFSSATKVAATGDSLTDANYPSLGRQHRLYVELAFAKRSFQPGCCAPSQAWVAERLAISRQRVQENQTRLASLPLIQIDSRQGPRQVNQVYVLPRSVPGTRKQRRKAVVAAAWRCTQLQLPFRVQWLIEEASYQGAAVRLSLAALAAQTGAERHNVWRAIQRNIALGRVNVQVSGSGRNRVCDFTITGTATPLRTPTVVVIDGSDLAADATRADASDWLVQQVFHNDDPSPRRRR